MTIESYMKFATNLKDFITKNNLSLKDLADKIEVPPSTVHGWINGVPPKSILTLKRIASVMNFTIDELCYDDPVDSHDPNVSITIGNTIYKIILRKIKDKQND